MPTDPILTIIVPAFNEEAALQHFLPELLQKCREDNYRLIVVNDASTDKIR